MSRGEIRRVITGVDSDGRSTIVEDSLSPAVRKVVERPGYYATNIWRTGAAPVVVSEPDQVLAHEGVLPPKGGTVIRVIEFPPEPKDPEELARQLRASFGKIFNDAERSQGQEIHPGMHLTDTVDYAIVLEGEIVAIMEASETTLRAGDILVQRGTNHAWSNRSGKPCKVVFVLIDGSQERD